MGSDRARQWVNLVLAFAQPITAVVAFGSGTDFDELTDQGASKTLIEPAGYVFIIWSVIYLGTMAYAVYQALPSRRQEPLLRRVGWFTASAFLSVVAWLVAARCGQLWPTVACIVWMLASLLVPFREFARPAAPLAPRQRVLVVAPLSIFLGWVSVATFANTAAALKVSGWLDVGPGEEVWAVGMLVAAGALGAAATYWSGGNAGYGLTLIWAFAGIAAADRMRAAGTAVGPVAAATAVVIVVTLVATRWSGRGWTMLPPRAVPGAAPDRRGM